MNRPRFVAMVRMDAVSPRVPEPGRITFRAARTEAHLRLHGNIAEEQRKHREQVEDEHHRRRRERLLEAMDEAMPACAAFVREMDSDFGPVAIISAIENGIRLVDPMRTRA